MHWIVQDNESDNGNNNQVNGYLCNSQSKINGGNTNSNHDNQLLKIKSEQVAKILL